MPMYDERLVAPMRHELTRIGFRELRTAVVNSICGCAARNARPAVAIAMRNAVRPEHLATVFAGQDPDATQRARGYFIGYPPSSPSIGLLKDGKLVFMLERWQIEGRPAPEIAGDLVEAFDKYCQSVETPA
jgi:putative YphP/YqiW family bacilliredoxin